MHNLGTVIGFEFLRTVRKRTFWIGALAFPVLIIVIGAISYLSNIAAEEADEAAQIRGFELVVHDASGLVTPEALDAFGARLVEGRQAGIDLVLSGAVDGFAFYPADLINDPVEVFGQDLSIGQNGRYEYAAREILHISLLAEVASEERRALLDRGFGTTLTTYVDGVEAEGFRAMVAPGLFLVLFFIIIILLGNQMLNSVTEEKENRVIEMMLTTITARAMIVGKIVSIGLLGLVQIVVIAVPVVLALVLFGDTLDINLNLFELVFDPVRIAVGAILLLLSFMFVTGILVTVSAAMPTAKEAGSFLGFAIFANFVPFYAVWPIITDPDQIIVQIFTYVPLTSPVTLLLRNTVDNISPAELSVAMAILATAAVVSLWGAIRAFKRGTLQYTRRLSIRELFGRT